MIHYLLFHVLIIFSFIHISMRSFCIRMESSGSVPKMALWSNDLLWNGTHEINISQADKQITCNYVSLLSNIELKFEWINVGILAAINNIQII